MVPGELQREIDRIPAGGWAVGVSGGADSVSLLRLARMRPDLRLVVAHLDHQTRGGASRGDAAFVADLAQGLSIPCIVARRSEIEPQLRRRPNNPSALYRASRIHLFTQVVASHQLQGVLLAHHADDQAETVLQRLLRGSGPAGLAGMSRRSEVRALVMYRPLLGARRASLRALLGAMGQSWREDASNRAPIYLRNRLRTLLDRHPAISDAMLELSAAMRDLRAWTRATAPELGSGFNSADLEGWPSLLAEQSMRRWLAKAGVPREQIDPPVIERLRMMLVDAAAPPRGHFPGRILVQRRRGWISSIGDESAG